VSSTNPGLANLLQTLTSVNSPLLSSPSAISAIENSSPADIVKLSVDATQLQEVNAMFGDSNTTAAPDSLFNGTNTFAALESALTSPSAATGSTGSTVAATQLPADQGSLQAAEADALLDPGLTSSSPSSLFSVLA
jgi:hypothetical protein